MAVTAARTEPRHRSFAVQRNGATNNVMRKSALPALLVALFLAAGAPALAANCSEIAEQLSAQYGGAEIVSAREKEGGCEVKLRIPGQGGQPPRVEKFNIPG
jgi:hypothetical protein